MSHRLKMQPAEREIEKKAKHLGRRNWGDSFTLLFCALNICSFQKSGSKNLVREIWFEKSGSRNLVEKRVSANSDFFSGSRKVVDQKNRWVYTIKPPFFWSTTFLEPDFSNQISRTTFLEPLFYTFLETWLQNKWLSV